MEQQVGYRRNLLFFSAWITFLRLGSWQQRFDSFGVESRKLRLLRELSFRAITGYVITENFCVIETRGISECDANVSSSFLSMRYTTAARIGGARIALIVNGCACNAVQSIFTFLSFLSPSIIASILISPFLFFYFFECQFLRFFAFDHPSRRLLKSDDRK